VVTCTGRSVDAGISGGDGHCRIIAGNCSISASQLPPPPPLVGLGSRERGLRLVIREDWPRTEM
jgi:hypothetical protein